MPQSFRSFRNSHNAVLMQVRFVALPATSRRRVSHYEKRDGQFATPPPDASEPRSTNPNLRASVPGLVQLVPEHAEKFAIRVAI